MYGYDEISADGFKHLLECTSPPPIAVNFDHLTPEQFEDISRNGDIHSIHLTSIDDTGEGTRYSAEIAIDWYDTEIELEQLTNSGDSISTTKRGTIGAVTAYLVTGVHPEKEVLDHDGLVDAIQYRNTAQKPAPTLFEENEQQALALRERISETLTPAPDSYAADYYGAIVSLSRSYSMGLISPESAVAEHQAAIAVELDRFNEVISTHETAVTDFLRTVDRTDLPGSPDETPAAWSELLDHQLEQQWRNSPAIHDHVKRYNASNLAQSL